MSRNYRMIAGPAANVAVGSVTDASPQDAMSSKGYVQCCLSGTTSQRPKGGDGDLPSPGGGVLQAGILFLDLTLQKIIVTDGAGSWRDPYTGSTL